MQARRIGRVLIGVAVSLLFVVLALQDVDWDGFVRALHQASLLPLAAAAVLAMLGVYARALRWYVMVLPLQRVALWRLFEVLLIGSMANNVLPVRLGELVRAFLLGRAERMSKSAVLATVLYERIVDVFATLMLLWLALFFTPVPSWLRRGGLWLLLLNLLLLGLLIAMVRFRSRVADLGQRLARSLGERVAARVRAICDSFASGLVVATSAGGTLAIAGISLIVVAASILAVYCCFPGMALNQGLRAAVTLTVLVSFAMMIPAAPGNIGPVQYACVVGLGLYHVDRATALAFSLVYHATQYLPVTLVGLLLLLRQQIGLMELASSSEQSEDPGGSD